MKPVSVPEADKEYEDLVKLANQSERSLNDLIREAVRQYLKEDTRG